MRQFIAIVWLAIGLCAHSARAQQEYQSESKGWKFTAPEGWNQISFELMKHEEEQSAMEWPGKPFKYIAGFTRGGMNTFSYPFIAVNRTDIDLTNVKYEDFEEGWALQDTAESSREVALAEFVYLNFGENGSVDREKGRLISGYETVDEDDKEVVATFYTYLGKTQSIQFECYDLKERGTANKKYFDEFVNTFEMREDLQYVPTAGKSQFDRSNYGEGTRSRRGGGGYGRYGFYGFGGVGATVALLLLWLRRD